MMTLDTREFNQALIQYAAASNKDFAEVVNRQVNNIAVQGVMWTKEAEKSSIMSLSDQPWWQLYVAKVINKSKGNYKGGGSSDRFGGVRNFNSKMQSIGDKLIKKRLVAIKFLKFFFATLSNVVAPYTPGGKVKKIGKSFSGMKPVIKIATPQDPTCDFTIAYEYKKRSAPTVQKAQRLLDAALSSAIGLAMLDMQKYIDAKMEKTAKLFSALGAR